MPPLIACIIPYPVAECKCGAGKASKRRGDVMSDVPDVWGLLQEARAMLHNVHDSFQVIDQIDAALAMRNDWQLVQKEPSSRQMREGKLVMIQLPSLPERRILYEHCGDETVILGYLQMDLEAYGLSCIAAYRGQIAKQEPVAWLTADLKESCTAGDKRAWNQQDEMKHIATEHCVPCFLHPVYGRTLAREQK
jgi:hypothetical protein